MVYQISIYEIKWISCQWIIHLICSFITTSESFVFFFWWCMWQKRIINFLLFYFVIWTETKKKHTTFLNRDVVIDWLWWCGAEEVERILLYLVFCIDYARRWFLRDGRFLGIFISYWFCSWVYVVWDFLNKIIENKSVMNKTRGERNSEIVLVRFGIHCKNMRYKTWLKLVKK